MSNSIFPRDFLWGAATSAYQIEGSPLADGAGENIWHRFCQKPHAIEDGSNGDSACDHYRRFAEDVLLMRELGLNAYRFSIAWSRVLPEGRGRVNRKGLDFYERLVDLLLEHQIEPMATLYHWDLPQALEDEGGWAHALSPAWFTEYATVMFRSLGDRVKFWATINEPWVIVDQGYVVGRHAPGRCDLAEAVRVAQNLMRAHAGAVVAYRDVGKHSIGLVVNLVPVFPATDSEADRQAASRLDAYLNRQFLDAALLGEVPDPLPQIFGRDWCPWGDDELRRIRQPIDFVGINYYLRLVVADDAAAGPAGARVVPQSGMPHTAMGWEVYPEGLSEILQWVKLRYGDVPLYITENGAACDDILLPNRTVDDIQRIQYLNDHLLAASRAIDAGVNLRGYFVWSLLDNFEWQCGYSKRFGIITVDFESQQRIPKSSAHFYSNVIRTNGSALCG